MRRWRHPVRQAASRPARPSPDRSAWLPRPGWPASLQQIEGVRLHRLPFARFPIGPDHANIRLFGRPESEMPPSVLAAGMAAADGDFAAHHPVAGAYLEPAADRVDVGAWLHGPDLDPAARILRGGAPELHGGVAVDNHLVDEPVEVEVRQSRAPRGHPACNPRLVTRLAELAARSLQQQVVGILPGEVGHFPD